MDGGPTMHVTILLEGAVLSEDDWPMSRALDADVMTSVEVGDQPYRIVGYSMTKPGAKQPMKEIIVKKVVGVAAPSTFPHPPAEARHRRPWWAFWRSRAL
jgi:hypothetical protein